jgi:pyridoxal phosphate enzyme (YggS family)
MSPIESKLQHIHTLINAAIGSLPPQARKPVTLVAVSKTKTAEDVRAAFAAGQREYGENYVQEAIRKMEALADLREQGIIWHFIGPLQSNKLKLVATHFDWVHGIDRLKVAEALSRHRSEFGPVQRPLNVCVQVNVSGEASKGGVAPADTLALAKQVAGMSHLKLRGLMTIIEDTVEETTQRAQFQKMRTLFEEMQSEGLDVDTLSMGMSQDFSIAIAEGATMVRIGSAIFGARQ